MAHPFQAPAEAPTIRSGRKCSRNTLQAPTSQAAQSPPAESTSAVISPELHRIAPPFRRRPLPNHGSAQRVGCRLDWSLVTNDDPPRRVAPPAGMHCRCPTGRRRATRCDLRSARRRQSLPGLAVLVRKDGRTVFERGYGVRDLRSLRKIDAVTISASRRSPSSSPRWPSCSWYATANSATTSR